MISRLTALLGVFAFLSACGGSSGSSSPPPPPPPPPNVAPIVDAGTDATIQLPDDTVALDATVTDDGLPSNTLTFAWSVSSGPDGATFADASAEDTTVTFVSVGTYVLELTVSDSALASSDTVQVTVEPAVAVNNPPTANDQSVSTPEDTPLAITLTGTDPDGDDLTYTIVAQPTSGTLTGTEPNVTYTPNAGFVGDDSFTFTVNDGTVDSAAATVSITVTAVNNAPTADDQSVITNQDVAQDITLTGSDPDGDALTFAIGTPPVSGTLSGELDGDELVTYTPNGGFAGSDSFTFTVNDGTEDSAEATVSITVCTACAYWQFDTGTGTTAFDAWGDSDGTIVDVTAPSWTAGVSGAGTDFALDFDGIGDYVDIGDPTALDITDTSITLTAWILPRDGGIPNAGSRVISKMNEVGNGDVYAMYTQDFRLRFRTVDGVDMISDYIFTVNEWVHVAMVYDGIDQRIYINGVLDTAPPQLENSPIPTSSNPVQLGRRGDDSRYFNGIIDEARVYDRALTAAEVAAIAEAVTPVNPVPAALSE